MPLQIGALGITLVIGVLLEYAHVTWLPEAGVGVIVGALVSGGSQLAGYDSMLELQSFDFEFFMTWLLPPIIFEAGFNMNVKSFFKNFGPTMIFAFIGTFLSTFAVGGLVWKAGQMGLCYPMGMLASLTFGSLISATDPVTVLAVFQALGVKVDLFSMVFGESVLNDAVAIVLSRTLLSFKEPGAVVNGESLGAALVLFLTIFVGSMCIGIVAGLASSFVFKILNLRRHDELIYTEGALSFVFPWMAYFAAEALSWSGIVSIMFCGIIMASYTRSNFSPEAVILTQRAYKCIAFVAETFVFVYLGLAIFAMPIFEATHWWLFAFALGACFIGRLHIFLGSWLVNCLRKSEGDPTRKTCEPPKISFTYMFIMWFSGLRGGVAFALASVSFGKNDFPQMCGGYDGFGCSAKAAGYTDSMAILQTTMLIAAFTIFVFGGSISHICKICGVIATPEEKRAVEERQASEKKSGWHVFLERKLTNASALKQALQHKRHVGSDVAML